jgi:hypothetical protein
MRTRCFGCQEFHKIHVSIAIFFTETRKLGSVKFCEPCWNSPRNGGFGDVVDFFNDQIKWRRHDGTKSTNRSLLASGDEHPASHLKRSRERLHQLAVAVSQWASRVRIFSH